MFASYRVTLLHCTEKKIDAANSNKAMADENIAMEADSGMRTSRGCPLKNANVMVPQEPSGEEEEAKREKESNEYAGTWMLDDAMLTSSPLDEPDYDELDHDVQVLLFSATSTVGIVTVSCNLRMFVCQKGGRDALVLGLHLLVLKHT
jgi:hypothetical protein